MNQTMDNKPLRQSARSYLLALLAVAAATLLIVWVEPLRERGALLVLLAVVSLVTWFGGWRPGVLAITLSVLVSAWLVLPPKDSLVIQSWDDLLRLGVFIFVAGLIAMLHASRERAVADRWQTEQRLAFALRCAQMGAWYSDLRTGRFWWSEGMEHLFGRPPGEFSGTYEGFIGYIHPDDQDFVKRAMTRIVEGAKEFEIEHRVVRPDGQTRWIVTRGRIVSDEAGTAYQVIGVAADITEQKKAQEIKAAG